MSLQPTRGLLLVRQIEAEKMIGSIHVLDSTADRMTCQQAEIVAVGQEPYYELDAVPESWWKPTEGYARATGPYAFGKYVNDTHVYYRPVDPRLTVGAWVILQARVLIPTDEPNLFAIRQDNTIGVFI